MSPCVSNPALINSAPPSLSLAVAEMVELCVFVCVLLLLLLLSPVLPVALTCPQCARQLSPSCAGLELFDRFQDNQLTLLSIKRQSGRAVRFKFSNDLNPPRLSPESK